MKTPREILLARHGSAESKLDALTRSIVNNIADTAPARRSISLHSLAQSFWREVIIPSRHLWTGLAAIWVLIIIANLDFHYAAPRFTASISPAEARNFMSIREQENIITAFNTLPDPAPAEPPKSRATQPRTELRNEFLII
jgi:hypothetical protein